MAIVHSEAVCFVSGSVFLSVGASASARYAAFLHVTMIVIPIFFSLVLIPSTMSLILRY